MLRTQRLAALLAALWIPAACTLGNSERDPVATSTIGAEGGILGIEGGTFDGLLLFVPSGVFQGDIEVGLYLDSITPLEQYRPISAPARIEPSGLRFEAPAQPTARIFYREDLVPSGARTSDLLVLHRDTATGEITPLLPDEVDPSVGRIRVTLPAFGVIWAVAPVPTLDIDLADHMQLTDGNVWLFDQNFRMTATERSDVANLPGQTVHGLRMEFGATLDLSLLLAFDGPGGDLLEYGVESESLDRQDLRDNPYRFLPALGGVGTLVPSSTSYRIFTPLGSAAVADTGTLNSVVELLSRETVVTPAGVFSDALRVSVQQIWEPANSAAEILLLDLWLVDGVGPVQLRLGGDNGLPPVVLTAATTLE